MYSLCLSEKNTDINPTLVLIQRWPKGPDRSGPQAPVTKLSSRWPFGVAIFAVAQWRIVLALIRH